ncbi:MAG: hypothetical protein MJ252_07850 [archaeon]|nr:hypothetical protein [archaeon]
MAEPDLLLSGLNSDLFLTDLRSNKITNRIKEAHMNEVLSCHFEMMNKYLICSTGTDFTIKYWDIRKDNECVAAIFGNSHWVWSCKYNKNYPNVLVTSSSSSVVRNIIFGKKEEDEKEDEIGSTFDKNFKDYFFIDYCEFEDSVYSVDWLYNENMTFAGISFNSFFHINTIPSDIQYKILM